MSEAGLTIDRALEWFLAGWSSEGPRVPSADTVRTYRYHLRSFARFAHEHGKLDVGEALQPDFLRVALRDRLSDSGQHGPRYKGGEANGAGLVQATRQFAKWLIAQGVPVSSLSTVKPPRPPERTQPRLMPDEFAALKQAVLDQLLRGNGPATPKTVARDLALIYMLADTGLRCGEVVGMSIDDIDFDLGRVVVRRGKGNKGRMLSIADPSDPSGGTTLRLLAEWIRVRETVRNADRHSRLWISVPHGRPLSRSTLRNVLSTLCKSAGLDGNRPPHAFRRAHFTEQYRASPESIKVLSARMGWSPKSHHMASVYTRGADLDFAAEVAMPSLASQWGGGAPQQPPPLLSTSVAVATHARQTTRRRSAPAVTDVLDSIKSDPELRKALLQALLGGAS